MDLPRHIKNSIKCDFEELAKGIDLHHISSFEQRPKTNAEQSARNALSCAQAILNHLEALIETMNY